MKSKTGRTATLAVTLAAALLLSKSDSARGAERLKLEFTTTPAGGKRAPKNCVAVWVETEDGKLVKTLARWAKKRAKELAQWHAADGTDIDGRTGATLKDYQRHLVEWNLRDRRGRLLPDGIYTIRLEMTDDDKKKNKFHRTRLRLEKNGQARRKAIPLKDGFANVVLDYKVTQDTAPRLALSSSSEIEPTAVTLGGRVTDAGGGDPVVQVYWGETDGGMKASSWEHEVKLGPKGEQPFATRVENLTTDKTYFFRCRAENAVGATWSETGTFIPCETFTVFDEGDRWRYFEGSKAPPRDWNTPSFDDSGWGEGPAGFGYGDDDDRTVFEDMKDGFIALFLRTTFQLDAPDRVQSAVFTVDYDDGFVAYLNGKEIARRNVKPGQNHETAAADSHEAGEPETIDLTQHRGHLREGANVFAIQVHNREVDSSDLSMIPRLELAGGRRAAAAP